jgi:hypothetical protein
MLGTWVGLAASAFFGARGGATAAKSASGGRARAAATSIAYYTGGIGLVLAPFLLFYASRGKLGALLAGYRWTVQESSGHVQFPGRDWVYGDAFDSLWALRHHVDKPDTFVVARALDFVLAPALAVIGLAHVVAAILRRRFVQRTAVVLGLSVVSAAVLHHAFLAADAWHFANASTPGIVLLFALGAGGRRLLVRGRGGRVLPLGVVAAALLPALWFLNGGWGPVDMRLARMASGEERPSTGERYSYPDLPRVGDVSIGNEHLEPVRWIRAHSSPGDPVWCTTWMLGGGTEAFLSERRNPTSFDKPDEVSGPAQRAQLLRELEAEPPRLIVGKFFDVVGDETRRLVEKDWRVVGAPHGLEMRERKR